MEQVALALTGWTYATAPGATPRAANWEYFGAPMEVREQNHATSAKSFLGCSVPAGQSVTQDLDSLLDCLMAHPNTAPFIATLSRAPHLELAQLDGRPLAQLDPTRFHQLELTWR